MPWFLGNSVHYNSFYWVRWGIVPMIVWSSFWKGLALWYAARRGETWWFIGLLCINTAGILEICYLAFVVKLFSSSHATSTKKSKKR